MRLRQALLPYNTHSVTWTGVLVVAVGLFGPVIANHVHTLPADLVGAIDSFGKVLVPIGTTLTVIGRSPQVPSGP